MALSIDVNLPRKHKPKFPDCCVVCETPSPGSHVRIFTSTASWWSWIFWWYGKWIVVKAPACPFCAWKLHALRFLSIAVTGAIAYVGLFFFWPMMKESIPIGLRKWAMLGIGLVCIAPFLLLEVFFAMPFNVTAHKDSIDYEFTSIDYAVDFGMCNYDAAWVKIGDETVDPP